jgi:hypothetical protein
MFEDQLADRHDADRPEIPIVGKNYEFAYCIT